MGILFLILGLGFSAPEQKAASKEIPTQPDGPCVHFQAFDDPDWDSNYFPSSLPQYDGEWKVQPSNLAPHEKMVFAVTPNAHYSLSTKFDSPLNLRDQTLVVQYEVRFQEPLSCGGAYIKVYDSSFDPNLVSPTTPYIIMFGPDRCGSTDKVQFNFRHRNSRTGQVVEHKLNDCPPVKNDKLNHLYTLIVRPDNTYEILIDAISEKQGSLLTDFTPPVDPPKEIDDPNDKKPSDWVDEEMYPDPNAKKPDDWDEEAPEFIPNPNKLTPPRGWLLDEPPMIPDPSIPKPTEWNDDFFGTWEAPLIDNPKCENAPGCGKYYPPAIRNPAYKGKWSAPKIKNPAYKGKWAPRKIANPNYSSETSVHNFQTISGVGFEFMTINKGIGFNNVLVATDEATVHRWNRQYFYAKRRQQNLELKRLEPKEGMLEFEKPKATPKPKRAARPAKPKQQKVPGQKQPQLETMASLNDFAIILTNTWMLLYNANQVAAIVFTALLILLPMSICTLAFIPRGTAPDQKRQKQGGSKQEGSKQEGKHRRRRKIVYEYSDSEEEEENEKPSQSRNSKENKKNK